MLEPDRPSAEHFLSLIRQRHQGRFKLYLGMAAGVGKTYRMLEEAAALHARGLQVVVGAVETHGRADTAAKLVGLEQQPPHTTYYKGKAFDELDLEALLRRHPDLVVVDELAHTNAPGSRHEKRYQDVEALLDAGINVISALNVQHLESLHGLVERITGVAVAERVPDRILARADEIVTVDLPADELITRLREGKVYQPDKVEAALKHFFTLENLSQLRELALREVAARLERRLDQSLPKSKRVGPTKLCVAISTNAASGRHLIRKVARIAAEQDAQWVVTFVETPELAFDRIALADQRQLIQNFELALKLGGTVAQLKGTDVPQAIVDYARTNGYSVLVIGKARPNWLDVLLRRDFLSRLLALLEDQDLDLLILN